MDRFETLLTRLSQLLLALAALAGLLMMLHVTADAVARTTLDAPLPGTNQMVAAYYMIAATFLPFAALAAVDKHITADVFAEAMPRRLRAVLEAGVLLLSIAYMALFTWQGVVSAQRRMAQNELLEIPGGYLVTWPGRWLVPVAGASMTLWLVLRLVRHLRGR